MEFATFEHWFIFKFILFCKFKCWNDVLPAFPNSQVQLFMKNLNILIQLTSSCIFSPLVLLASEQISSCDKWYFVLVTLWELRREWFLWLSPNDWRRPGGKGWSHRQVWTSKVSEKLSDFTLDYLRVINVVWKHIIKFAETQYIWNRMSSEFVVNV